MALLKRKRVGLNDAMSVVTRFVNACNRHDADGVGACLHPDFDSIQPMYPSRNFRGADQVRRNWQAIFDAEPGFRLTVLRSAAADDTVWLELHGAGRDAEVAGVFVMGVQGDRIRWARIYSALVEPVPEGMGEPAVPLHEVPHPQDVAVAGSDGVVEEPLIAPVLDIERSGRRRRRRGTSTEDGATETGTTEPPTTETGTDAADDAEAEAADEVVVVDEAADEVVADAEPDVGVVVADGPEAVVAAEADENATVVVVDQAEEAGPVVTADDEVDDDEGGPPTEAVEMVGFAELDFDDDDPVPFEPAPPDEPPKRRFGKRPRP